MFKKALDLVMRKLASREHTARELSRYLERKGVDPATITSVIEELTRGRWIDEKRFAEALIHGQKRRGKGPAFIANKLREKGLSYSVAEVKKYYDVDAGGSDTTPVSEEDAARAVVERKYPGYTEDPAIARRAFQGLLRRGFSFEVANRIIRHK